MIVIFPSGLEIDYTGAHFIVTEGTSHRLYNDNQKSQFIAAVPLDCVVQIGYTSRSMQNHTMFATPERALDFTIKNIRDKGLNLYKLRELKKVLESFNAKQLFWEDHK